MEEQKVRVAAWQFGLRCQNCGKMPCRLGKFCVWVWALVLSDHPPPSGRCSAQEAQGNLPRKVYLFLMLSSDKVTLFDGCTQSVGGRHHIPCTALEWLHLTNKRVLN